MTSQILPNSNCARKIPLACFLLATFLPQPASGISCLPSIPAIIETFSTWFKVKAVAAVLAEVPVVEVLVVAGVALALVEVVRPVAVSEEPEKTDFWSPSTRTSTSTAWGRIEPQQCL